MAPRIWKKTQIERIEGGARFTYEDSVILEETYKITLNQTHEISVACSPLDLRELAAGYALSKGFIRSSRELQKLVVNEETREIQLETRQQDMHFYAETESASFTVDEIFAFWEAFDEQCIYFHKTGAAHAVALVGRDGIIALKEDVARHNALLKVLGYALLNDIPLENKGLFFSGRVAAEMVNMTVGTGVRILLCHGAATSGAIEMAAANHITLVGFIRKGYMNIYIGNERVR